MRLHYHEVYYTIYIYIPHVFSHSRPYAIHTPLAGIHPLQTSDNSLLLICPQSRPLMQGTSLIIIGLLYVFSISVHVLAMKYKQMIHRNQFL